MVPVVDGLVHDAWFPSFILPPDEYVKTAFPDQSLKFSFPAEWLLFLWQINDLLSIAHAAGRGGVSSIGIYALVMTCANARGEIVLNAKQR